MAETLERYAAEGALRRIELKPGDRKALDTILTSMGADGRAKVSDLLDTLFPTANSRDSANKKLQRLIKGVNPTLAVSGLELCITLNRTAGAANRFVWVEGPPTWSPDVATGALDAIAPEALLDQRAKETGSLPVAVILTFNPHETQALRKTFTGSEAEPPTQVRGNRTYFELGSVGGLRVLHAVSQQGVRAAQSTASHAVQHWSPNVIIACGIAFGVAKGSQRIGDVLVSQATWDYDNVRVNPDGTRTYRDVHQPASDVLYRRAYELNQTPVDGRPLLHLGVMLAGEALVDNLTYRDTLAGQSAGVVGGDMEGSGVAEACRASKTDWIVVKGICDWGDGNVKKPTKEADQRTAANSAARITFALLAKGPVGPGAERNIPRPTPHWAEDQVLDRAELVPQQRGARMSLIQSDAEPSTVEGTPVLDAMIEWALDPEAPIAFALLGEYGMGKTVTAQRFARELKERRLSDPSIPMPLYFDLKRIADAAEATTLQTTVVRCMQDGWLPRANPDFTWDAFVEWLRTAACIVIFDGLDELLVKFPTSLGDSFTQRLLGVTDVAGAAGAQTKVVVSCRTQYFPTLRAQRNHFLLRGREDVSPDSYQAMTLLPLDDGQVRAYLGAALPDLSVDRVIDMVRSVHNLTELSTRPVTLKLISEQIPRLEQKRAAGERVFGVTLYRGMAETWLDRDETKHYLKREHKLRLVQHLAAELWQRGVNSLPTPELEKWFVLWRDGDPELRARYAAFDADRLEEDLRTATFLSRDDSGAVSSFRFAHTSLGEFFLALYLFEAIQTNSPERWAMRTPSAETLDFLGQLLAEQNDQAVMQRLSGWRRPYRSQVSELLLHYALYAHAHELPTPTVRGISLPGATLDDLVVDGRSHKTGAPLSLAGADFSGASLRRATFRFVDLRGANFHTSLLTQATFHEADTEGCSWPSASPGAVWSSIVGPTRADAIGTVVWGDGHTDRIDRCTWSPDGSRLATHSGGGVRIWDPISGTNTNLIAGSLSQFSWSPDSARLAVTNASDLCISHVLTGISVIHPSFDAGRVTDCAWSPDGMRIAVASDAGATEIVDLDGGTLHRLVSHGSVSQCIWSPSGARLATISEDGVQTWDSETGAPLVHLAAEATHCTWSPDGSRLATTGSDGTARIWDSDTGGDLKTWPGDPHWAAAFSELLYSFTLFASSWSPCDSRIALSNKEGVRIWDPTTDSNPVRLTFEATCFAWSPDGGRVATADTHGLHIWDADTATAVIHLTGLPGMVTSCAWSPDGSRLAATSNAGIAHIWDPITGITLTQLNCRASSVHHCAWAPDGERIVAIGRDNVGRIWDPVSDMCPTILSGHSQFINHAAWAPDGSKVATVSSDYTARIWNPDDGQSTVLNGHTFWVSHCAWSPDSAKLATTSYDQTVRIWDPMTGQSHEVLVGHEKYVRCCAWAPNGALLATADDGGSVLIWDSVTWQIRHKLVGHTDRVLHIAWSPDARQLSSTSIDGSVRVWDPETGLQTATYTGVVDDSDWMTAWCPSRNLLAVTSRDGRVSIWDPQARQVRVTLVGHTNSITYCAWSPDGTRLATTSHDDTARIWDSVTGETIATCIGHTNSVWDCDWSKDGARLATASRDGTVGIWDTTTGAVVRVVAGARDEALESYGSAAWRPRSGTIDFIEGAAWRSIYVSPIVGGPIGHPEVPGIRWTPPAD